MKEVINSRRQVASPCAACKLLRRRCTKECMFAPHFPADQPQKFATVHKVFGASNVNKLLQELPESHRSDAVSSMVYEANARIRDPIYGCVGAISSLQRQVEQLQTQLAIAQAEMVHLKIRHSGNNNSNNAYFANPGHGVGESGAGNGSVSMSGSSASMYELDLVVEQNGINQLMWSY